MTIEQLSLSVFRAVTVPPTKEEYNILGISKFDVIKRRYFRNVYGTLILYLIKLSIPGAFPNHSLELVETFDEYFQMAYRDNQREKNRVAERLMKFEELVKLQTQQPFLDLALYITEMFEHRPRKLLYAARLNSRIEELFFNFLTLGKEVKII